MTSQAPAGTQAAEEWAREYVQAWGAHDPSAVTAYLAEDAVVEDVALRVRCESRDEVAQYVQSLHDTTSTDYRIELTSAFGDGDHVALEWIVEGTNDRADPARGLPATGRRFRTPGASLTWLRGGRVVRDRHYYDLAGFLQQVGLVPTPR
ncbi:ester cyclase [Kineococcus sp. SYSU DK003]|uniref:ester cyclase n=1 Tax=Kineococcus sp. SYSU DK003 TaxID=3383124 RepID=UPI003D7E71B2